MNQAPSRTLLRKIFRIAGWVFAILLILGLIGFIVIPPAAKLYIHHWAPDLYKSLSRNPRVYTSLPKPPPDWQKIALGNVSMSLPLAELTHIVKTPKSYYMRMMFKNYSLDLSWLAFTMSSMKVHWEKVSFQLVESYARAHPDQISFFKWPWRNWGTMIGLTFKAIAGMEIDIFTCGNIKGTVHQNSQRTSDYYSFMVFSKSDHFFFDFTVSSRNKLNQDEVLRILGGVEITKDSFDEAKYKADAQARYKELLEIARKNTSPNAPPD